jgi:hypothetical protein
MLIFKEGCLEKSEGRERRGEKRRDRDRKKRETERERLREKSGKQKYFLQDTSIILVMTREFLFLIFTFLSKISIIGHLFFIKIIPTISGINSRTTLCFTTL